MLRNLEVGDKVTVQPYIGKITKIGSTIIYVELLKIGYQPLVVLTIKNLASMNKKMYVLCNRRLSPVYAAVQGAHALAQWVLEHPGEYNEFTTLVFLNCNLPKKIEHMDEKGYNYSVWKEPDMNMTPTAVACLGDPELLFTRLKTLN